MQREGIRPPKFADKFALLDFEAAPLPAISLYPMPQAVAAEDLALDYCGLDCQPRRICLAGLESVPRVSVTAPLVCQIFNWSETVEWGGFRLIDVLQHFGLDLQDDTYCAFYSRDGVYFETLPAHLASDPRVLLATSLNGQCLPPVYGGPLRLVVPFLQGYKSVKWLNAIRVTKHDAIGIKRLLGQSKTGYLGQAWRSLYAIEHEPGRDKTPV